MIWKGIPISMPIGLSAGSTTHPPEEYVGEILSLMQIYEGLSEKEKERIKDQIIDLDLVQEEVSKPTTDEVLARFSDDNQAKVKKLMKGGVSI